MGVFKITITPTNFEKFFGAIAQLGERRPCKAEVIGSIPISSTKVNSFRLFFERLEE
jgi:hypothetical protein